MTDLNTVYAEAVELRNALQQDINLATTRIEHIRTSALANQAAHLVKNLERMGASHPVPNFPEPTHPVLFAETPSIH